MAVNNIAHGELDIKSRLRACDEKTEKREALRTNDVPGALFINYRDIS